MITEVQGEKISTVSDFRAAIDRMRSGQTIREFRSFGTRCPWVRTISIAGGLATRAAPLGVTWIGTKVAHDTTGVYEYLPASIRNFPDQERLKQLLLDAGFRQVTYRNLTGGIVAIHIATK